MQLLFSWGIDAPTETALTLQDAYVLYNTIMKKHAPRCNI